MRYLRLSPGAAPWSSRAFSASSSSEFSCHIHPGLAETMIAWMSALRRLLTSFCGSIRSRQNEGVTPRRKYGKKPTMVGVS